MSKSHKFLCKIKKLNTANIMLSLEINTKREREKTILWRQNKDRRNR